MNMKFTLLFYAFLAAALGHIAFASAIERSSGLTARDNSNDTVITPYEDVVSSFLPDGKHKIEFFSDGILQVTAIEREDGGVTFYDADGAVVEMDQLARDDNSLDKRVPKWKLAIKFAKLIAEYGKRAWSYIYCVGTAPFWKCGDEFLDCASAGRAPWNCYEGGLCIGMKLYKHCK